MPPIKDEAIVLRRLDYSESSQVLVFLSREHGQCRLIAKGIKRSTRDRFATGIDLLERGQLMFVQKSRTADGLGTLTDWRQTEAFLLLRDDMRLLYSAQYAAEITASLTQDSDPMPAVFDALNGVLSALAGKADPIVHLVMYQRTLLQESGLWPDFNRCVSCNKAAPRRRAGFFATHEGGLICRDCEPAVSEKRKVASLTLDSLRDDTPDPRAAGDAFGVLNYHISHIMGKPPRLAPFISSIARS
jgi:DNA repair protein RecO (recombination protein O)